MPKKLKKKPFDVSLLLVRIAYTSGLCFLAILCLLFVSILKTKEIAFDIAFLESADVPTPQKIEEVESFPFGVNPQSEEITENPAVDEYFEKHISKTAKAESKVSWFRKHITARLALFDWYQNLASPMSRILVIEPGERREQVVDNFGDILRWSEEERRMFTVLIASSTPELSEGKFYPGHYVTDKDANPEAIAQVLIEQFDSRIINHYTKEISDIVPLKDTVTIASLLEREAYDFQDMRFISGVIWNRLFVGMNLQIDASLQYAKASETQSGSWWPPARPEDKYIKSPFNTYKNEGLPPAPIANPSIEAILAALNPKETDCMFYFHDKDGGFHCTVTYEEHVRLLKEYYGKGQ